MLDNSPILKRPKIHTMIAHFMTALKDLLKKSLISVEKVCTPLQEFKFILTALWKYKIMPQPLRLIIDYTPEHPRTK